MDVFETERLICRPWTMEDVESAFAIYGDAEVMEFISEAVLDAAETAVTGRRPVGGKAPLGTHAIPVPLPSGDLTPDGGRDVVGAGDCGGVRRGRPRVRDQALPQRAPALAADAAGDRHVVRPLWRHRPGPGHRRSGNTACLGVHVADFVRNLCRIQMAYVSRHAGSRNGRAGIHTTDLSAILARDVAQGIRRNACREEANELSSNVACTRY